VLPRPAKPQARTTRAISARPILDVYSRVCPRVGICHREIGRFPVEFNEGGAWKNRCRYERKNSITQVLISRTLSVCGEVAEWPKAAVC
jgi:hypothetical protein